MLVANLMYLPANFITRSWHVIPQYDSMIVIKLSINMIYMPQEFLGKLKPYVPMDADHDC